jgi:hypothetical protein
VTKEVEGPGFVKTRVIHKLATAVCGTEGALVHVYDCLPRYEDAIFSWRVSDEEDPASSLGISQKFFNILQR